MQIFKQQNTAKMHFFDYSLWNHYVNVHLPLFKALMHGVWVIFYTINVFLIDYIFSLLIICFSFYIAPESYSGFSLYLFFVHFWSFWTNHFLFLSLHYTKPLSNSL